MTGLIAKLETGVATGDNRQSSVDRAKVAARHLVGFFGADERVSRITEERIDAYKRYRLPPEGRASKATVQLELAFLGEAFRIAHRNRKVAAVPYIQPIKVGDNSRTGLLDRHELDAILSHIPKAMRPPLLVAYHTGWRLRSSVLTLETRDVDLRTGMLRLRAERSKTGEAWEFPLEGELATIIAAQLERNRAWAARSGRIVPALFHDDGKPLAKVLPSGRVITNVPYHWKKARQRTGLPTAIPHDLRRSFATRGPEAGLDEREIIDLRGWKSPNMVQRYRQSRQRHKVAAVRRLMAFEAEITDKRPTIHRCPQRGRTKRREFPRGNPGSWPA